MTCLTNLISKLKRGKDMKSLKTKILVIVGGVALLAMIISAGIIINNVSRNSLMAESYITQLSGEQIAVQVDEYFSKYIKTVQLAADDNAIRHIASDCNSNEDILASSYYPMARDTLAATEAKGGDSFSDIYLLTVKDGVGMDGTGWLQDDETDLAGEEYWFDSDSKIKAGYVISTPYYEEDSEAIVVTVAAPVYDLDNNEILGVVGLDLKVDDLGKKIVEYASVYDTASKLLVSNTGSIIASANQDLVLKKIDEVGFGKEIPEAAQSGTDGVIKTTDNGNNIYASISKAKTTGWDVVYTVTEKEFMNDTNAMIRRTVMVYAVAVLALIIITLIVTNNIIKPVRKLNQITQQLAAGNLDTEVDILSADETGQLAESMRGLVARLREYIDYIEEISASLDRFASGQLDINLTLSYDGEFEKIKNSLLKVSRVFKDTIGQLVQTSERVASGSGEIAHAAQQLAMGATNQASTTEELTATINELSDRVTQNARQARDASLQVKQVGGTADMSNEQMREMIAAIAEINEKSSEIGKIIKTIEDIAFQTNILALNAAVEAARAGEAGKGFAVVADEVRNLASKSAEAAKDTTHLIEETVKAVENGTEIANKTGEMLGEVIEGVSQTVGLIQEISDASSLQADALKQTLNGVEEISQVTQTNAATAEESSASSDELSKQANALQNVASQFKL